jgi:hypothetical protein
MGEKIAAELHRLEDRNGTPGEKETHRQCLKQRVRDRVKGVPLAKGDGRCDDDQDSSGRQVGCHESHDEIRSCEKYQ